MVNSIKDKLDKTDTISEIKLMLGHDKKIVCVVVEGIDDIKLFSSLLSKKVVLFQSYNSKTGVDDIVTKYFPNINRVIGIRDKDYLAEPVSNKSFFCDYCCAEMMVISIDSCFERIYCNFYSQSKFDSDSLRLHCLEHLEMLSEFRKLSELNDWHMRFDGIKPSKHYRYNISEMNSSLISELNEQNPSNIINDDRMKIYDNLPKCSNINDYLNITNGHDFINLFCRICNDNPSNKSVESIAASLRSTLGKDEFRQTVLYSNLLTYQKEQNICIVD